ncbi:MAG TPA: hypothetical protein VK927_09510, partial [Adhaeribacter sp.]|nr:hypothetical protein [Adhaeribacter sp.]
IPAGGAQTFVGNAAASSVIRSVVASEPVSISSLTNGPIASNTDGVQVWQVTLFDGDGVNNDFDNLPTRYSSLTISAAGGNTVSNWGNTIEAAQFFEGSSTTPIAGSLTIVNNIIAFTPNSPIVVADGAGSSKTISLRITLKNTLPANSDGKVFRFQLVDGMVGVDAETLSSQLASFTAVSASNTNVIDVTATELAFINTPVSVFINTNFALTVSAVDKNGNVDTGYMTDISLNLGMGNGNISALSGLSSKSLNNGSYTWNDLRYDFAEDFAVDVTDHAGNGLPYVISPTIKATMLNFAGFDNFNRVNSNLLGAPSSGMSGIWSEQESAGSNNYRVRVAGNTLVLSSFNDAGTGSVDIEQASFDMTGKYATVFEQSAGDLVWAFNMRQSHTNPTGFSNGNGVAYVIGSTEANFASPTANGYAVVIGNPGTTKSVRLVRFTGGITNNANLTTIASETAANANDAFSIKVTFNPCTKGWDLMVRNDGATFADPATIAVVPVSGTDYNYTDGVLTYMGAYFYHQIGNVSATFDNLYIPNAGTSTPETFVWNGSNSTDFNDEYNWTPLRGCIRDTDMLVFNSGSPVTVMNVSSQVISQLVVTNNTTLTMRPLSGVTETLTLLNGAGDDLIVTAGSSLIIDGNNPLEISLAAGATGKVNGTIQFQNTANNLARAHRLLAEDANAIVFESGSRFVARNLFGEAFGNTGTANAVIFKGNATYVSRDGAAPFALTAPASKVVFETGSVYSHEQISNLPKFDGRTYGDFELNVPGTINVLVGNPDGAAANIDNLTILNGTLNFTLTNGTASQPLSIRGNVSVGAGSLLNYSP